MQKVHQKECRGGFTLTSCAPPVGGVRRHPRVGSRTSTSRAGVLVSEKGFECPHSVRSGLRSWSPSRAGHFSKETLCLSRLFVSPLSQPFTAAVQGKVQLCILQDSDSLFYHKKRPTLEGQIKSFLSLFNGIWMNRVKYAPLHSLIASFGGGN